MGTERVNICLFIIFDVEQHFRGHIHRGAQEASVSASPVDLTQPKVSHFHLN